MKSLFNLKAAVNFEARSQELTLSDHTNSCTEKLQSWADVVCGEKAPSAASSLDCSWVDQPLLEAPVIRRQAPSYVGPLKSLSNSSILS